MSFQFALCIFKSLVRPFSSLEGTKASVMWTPWTTAPFLKNQWRSDKKSLQFTEEISIDILFGCSMNSSLTTNREKTIKTYNELGKKIYT